MNSRYYDAETGRFVNADDVNLIPTMQSGIKGTNLFEYCDNNVVNKDDPTGQWSIKSTVNNAVKGIKNTLKKIWNSAFGRIVTVLCSIGTALYKVYKKLSNAAGIYDVFKKYRAAKSKKLFTKAMFNKKLQQVMKSVRNIKNMILDGIKWIKRHWKISLVIFTAALTMAIIYVSKGKAK